MRALFSGCGRRRQHDTLNGQEALLDPPETDLNRMQAAATPIPTIRFVSRLTPSK